MAEQILVDPDLPRKEKYAAVLPQIEALVSGESDLIANLANIAAVLKQVFGFFWVGFYRRIGDELVLGPFQGPLACTRIPLSKGVCGAAAREMKTILVPEVEKFPGHIACSSASKSEIVVPLVANGRTELVLDVDSDVLEDFSEVDQAGLEKILSRVQIAHFTEK